MIDYERWLRRCYRRLEFARFLQRFSMWLAVFTLVWGGLILFSKLEHPEWWPEVAWGGLAIIPLAVVCWWTGRLERFELLETAQVLDRAIGADGLLMSLAETSDENWRSKLPQETYEWRESIPLVLPLRFLRTQMWPAVFLTSALIIPAREALSHPRVTTSVSKQATGDLDRLLTKLTDEGVIAEEESSELRTQLDQLAEQTAQGPLTHENWEALDAIRERLDMRMATSLMNNQRAFEAATSMAQAMATAQANGGELSPERTGQLEGVVGEALKRFTGREDLPPELPGVVSQMIQNMDAEGGIKLPENPVDQLKLLSELQGFLQSDSQQLSDLQRMGQIANQVLGQDTNTLQQMLSAGMGTDWDPASVAGGLDPGTVEALQSAARARKPAFPRFGKERDSVASNFKSVVLPKDFVEEKVENGNRPPVAPITKPAAVVNRSETREMEATTGRETWSRSLRPRHRQAIRDYFSGATSESNGESTGTENGDSADPSPEEKNVE